MASETIRDYQGLLIEMKDSIITTLTLKIDELDAKITRLTDITTAHADQLKGHEERITQLENDLKAVVEKQKIIIEKQDDQINRSLRNNIVLKNVPGEDKNFDETKAVVAKLLCEMDNGEPTDESYINSIERAHRMGEVTSDGRPRPIVARLYCSEAVKHYVKKARIIRIQDKRYTIFADQQFSELITARRNQAMIKRRDLINAGTFASGYVDYPAKLMMKNKNDKYCKLYESF